METVLILVSLQALLGAFDGFYHHEITEKLSQNFNAKTELMLHAIRSAIYAIVFITLAGIEWHGIYAYAFLLLLLIELIITLSDFVIEDKTRDLPASERITHTLLTLNFGAVLALLIPIVVSWSQLDIAFTVVDHGLFSYFMLLFAFGVSLMAMRELSAYRSLVRRTLNKPITKSYQVTVKRYLITGATGFIGQQLCRRLLAQNQQVCILARDYRKVARLFGSDHRLNIISNLEQLNAQDAFDVIVNLAGEPLIGGIWSKQRKLRLLQSRIALTSQLVNYIRHCQQKPQVLVSGSAIGYYGSQQDLVLNESSGRVNSFSSQLCRQWEDVAKAAESYGVRTCLLRTGLVLGESGGLLGSMLFPFWYGLGGKIGNGRQWMSWISLEDLLNSIEHIIDDNTISGPINATAPNPVTNASFTHTLAKILHRPALFSIPAFVLRGLLGQAADELFLSSTRVVPDKLLKSGFQFVHPDLVSTLRGILSK